MNRLAIIPARAGSKRIARKNVAVFCGRPMIAHVIIAAAQSGLFTATHISTDSDEVAAVAATVGFAPEFMRPTVLANNHSSILEVMKYVVGEYQLRGKDFDTVTLLYATSPLLDPEDLQRACARFEEGDRKKPLLAVTPFPGPVERAFRLDEACGDLNPVNPTACVMRTQDLPSAYRDAGMFAIYTPEYILNSSGAGDFTAFQGYLVPSFRATDIDSHEDWKHAELLFKGLHMK
jgi:pseudaminic acid cytidylyltransferase